MIHLEVNAKPSILGRINITLLTEYGVIERSKKILCTQHSLSVHELDESVGYFRTLDCQDKTIKIRFVSTQIGGTLSAQVVGRVFNGKEVAGYLVEFTRMNPDHTGCVDVDIFDAASVAQLAKQWGNLENVVASGTGISGANGFELRGLPSFHIPLVRKELVHEINTLRVTKKYMSSLITARVNRGNDPKRSLILDDVDAYQLHNYGRQTIDIFGCQIQPNTLVVIRSDYIKSWLNDHWSVDKIERYNVQLLNAIVYRDVGENGAQFITLTDSCTDTIQVEATATVDDSLSNVVLNPELAGVFTVNEIEAAIEKNLYRNILIGAKARAATAPAGSERETAIKPASTAVTSSDKGKGDGIQSHSAGKQGIFGMFKRK